MARKPPLMSSILAAISVSLAAPASADDTNPRSVSRYVSPQHAATETSAIAAIGPFRVLDGARVALVDITDSRSPAQFAALLEAYPHIAVIEFVEAPGTHDDLANLQLGRMIRARGIATIAPEGGSIRSGAVELFIAGAARYIDEAAEFAVHGWTDDRGLGAEDYPAQAPEHRRYIDYYMEMDMNIQQAQAFYAMTNTVSFDQALWLTGSEMRGWLDDATMLAEKAQGAPILSASRLDFHPVLQ